MANCDRSFQATTFAKHPPGIVVEIVGTEMGDQGQPPLLPSHKKKAKDDGMLDGFSDKRREGGRLDVCYPIAAPNKNSSNLQGNSTKLRCRGGESFFLS